MRETSNTVNNEDIIDFAFNPESRKRVETLGEIVAAKPPGFGSPGDGANRGSLLS
jgi:hypothetical protein